jgi:hypothetical protein
LVKQNHNLDKNKNKNEDKKYAKATSAPNINNLEALNSSSSSICGAF